MPAYLIAEHIITDPVRSSTSIEQGSADDRQVRRPLPDEGRQPQAARGGHWKPERVVIIEFPDKARLDAWYASPEYQPLIALRKECTSDLDMLITLEGV
jgi:uncharacterized protein (DUF1330 family)